MTVTEVISRFVAETNYDDIPRDAVRIAKERVLDTAGVALAGAIEPAGAGKKVVELVRELGGPPDSTVIGGGFKTSAPQAGFANGTSAATLDYDDTSTYTMCHYSGALIPAVLAVAEAVKASGKQTLEAFILAWEVGTRIGACLGGASYSRGFHPSGIWACVGCAVSSAKLLHLDVQQIRTALGIAASAAGGIRKQYGTNTKPLYSGISARNGIIAAMLAKKGFTSDQDIMDSDPGLRPTAQLYFSFPMVFAGEGKYDLSRLTEGLGKSYNLVTQPVTTKLHPGPTAMGTLIEVVIDMMRENHIGVEQVEKVDVGVTRIHIDYGSPFVIPQTGDEARYSSHYQVAVAMLDGRVGIEQHREDRVHASDVAEVMQKVNVFERSGSEEVDRRIFETSDITRQGLCELTITLKDGRKFTGKGEFPKGSGALGPIDRQILLDKYEDCASRVLSASDVERSKQLIENLDDLPYVTELMALLGGKTT